MLNLKSIMLKRYKKTILRNKNGRFFDFSCHFQLLKTPEVSTAVFIYALYSKEYEKQGRIEPSIMETVSSFYRTAAELGDVDPYVFVDAISLIDAYNSGPEIVRMYRKRTGILLPFVIFHPMPWFYVVLDFLKDFDKENYPLVRNWEEFVLSLPELWHKKAVINLSFFDYVEALRNGEFDHWYGITKAAGKENAGYSWKKRYLVQL